MQRVFFVTHPDVVIDPAVPVTEWSLSDRGIARMRALSKHSWLGELGGIYCSAEKKAIDGAELLAETLHLPFISIEELGENDRTSTGYLPAAEFEAVADEFFARPLVSVRGWETANAAQQRIVNATNRVIADDQSAGSLLIVSHGAVGALLYCYLRNVPIDRKYDQPGAGGNYFSFERKSRKLLHGWRAIDTD